MKSESFLTPNESNASETIPGPDISKDIVKIVYVTI